MRGFYGGGRQPVRSMWKLVGETGFAPAWARARACLRRVCLLVAPLAERAGKYGSTARRETSSVSAFASSVMADGGDLVGAVRIALTWSRSQAECLKLLGYAPENGCGCRGRTDLAWAYETRRNDWFYPQWESCMPGRSRARPPGFGGRAVRWNYGHEAGHDGGIRTREQGLQADPLSRSGTS